MKDLAKKLPFYKQRTFLQSAVFVTSCAVTHSVGAERVRGDSASEADQVPGELTTVLVEGADTGKSEASVGTKIPSSLREVPQTISVITEERFQAQNLTTLEDVLNRTAGITVEPIDSHRLNLYSRGFQIEKMQINGLPTLMDDRVFLTPDLEMFERVELLRGPSGLLAGAGGAGGVINMVRKSPQEERAASGELSVGSWNNFRATVDATGALTGNGDLRGRAVAVYQDREFHFDVAEQDNTLLYGVLDYDLTSATMLTFGGSYQTLDARVPMALPGYSTYELLDVDRSTYLGADWNRDQYTTASAFVELQHRFANEWSARAALRHSKGALDRMQAYAWGSVDPEANTTDIYSLRDDYKQTQQGIDLYANGPFQLFGRDHHFLIGANLEHIELDQPDFSAEGDAVKGDFGLIAEGVDIFNPQTSFAQPNFVQGGVGTFTIDQYGMYTSARITLLDPLTLVLGGRVSWWENEIAEFDAEFTPLVGLIHEINNTYSVYTSYAEIFQPQDSRDLSGELLEPLTGRQYEAGVKGEFLDGSFNAALAAFSIQELNRAQDDPSTLEEDVYIASGEVQNDGVELELSGQLQPGWTIYGGYTYIETQEPEESAFDSSAFSAIAPRHSLSVWTNYQLPGAWENWQIGAGVTGKSRFYNQFGADELKQPSYVLIDARVAYEVNENTSLSLNASNLLDESYYQRINTPNSGNIYGRPREVTLALRFKL